MPVRRLRPAIELVGSFAVTSVILHLAFPRPSTSPITTAPPTRSGAVVSDDTSTDPPAAAPPLRTHPIPTADDRSRIDPARPAPFRLSRSSDWNQFAYAHGRASSVLEMALLETLRAGLDRIDLTCHVRELGPDYQRLGPRASDARYAVSGYATVDGNHLAVDGWGCDFDDDATADDRSLCDCITSTLPPRVELDVPDLHEPELTYEGGIRLPL